MGAIDVWCNGFTLDHKARWDEVIETQGLALRIRKGDDDSFTRPGDMVSRMDQIGFSTLLLAACEVPEHALPFAYERYASTPGLVSELARAHPGRFYGLFSLDPTTGQAGVEEADRALSRKQEFVGLHVHTHSWDRPFDHRDYYPYYALAADHDVPIIMQAGTSGGIMPSECGKPIGIDRPAIYFPRVRFVLSHLGWPWTDEAIAMAMKFPNVYIGTAAWPAHRWPASFVDFVKGQGRGKCMLGTSFPTVGHRHALARLEEIGLDPEVRLEYLEGAARRCFSRIA